MSLTAPLTLRWNVGGVPADVTSATITVLNSDTLATVITGTMTHAATGVYTFNDATLSDSINYTWTASITDTDGQVVPITFMRRGNAHYGSRAGIEAMIGLTNASVFADLQSDSNATEIAARFESTLTEADGELNMAFATLNATVPSSSSVFFPRVATLANKLSVGILLAARSRNNENPNEFRELWRKEAYEEIEKITWRIRFDTCAAGTPVLVVNDPSIAADLRATVGASVWF